MKKLILTIIFTILVSQFIFSQNQYSLKQNNSKGGIFIYWGWNWGWYSNSNISFKGDNYNFTLDKVVANDRQSKFNFNKYFNPKTITIPQYNFRIGYFISDHYSISFGIDHMKYVMQADQVVKISGNIDSTGTIYDGSYNDDYITLTEDVLIFEHTDGLNYINAEFRRFDEIVNLNKVRINLTEGIGIGALYPKTNTTLLNNKRYDEFHLAGYGISAVVAVNVTFYKYFFIQSEFKGGFINMPDIRTTMFATDKASQNFFFTQLNIVFGATLNFSKNKTNINNLD
mgnify:CR=1 FL=1